MSKPFIVMTALLSASVSFAPASKAGVGNRDVRTLQRLVSEPSPRSLYPKNVECKNFDKTGYKIWQLRDRSTIDLGNWDAAFPITGAIEPGTFVSKGVDLFDVLEIKCGLSAYTGQAAL